jgi:hypothetical protein
MAILAEQPRMKGRITTARPSACPWGLTRCREAACLGQVGPLVAILGTDLTGASTGKVQVVTSTGTLSSSLPFRVL